MVLVVLNIPPATSACTTTNDGVLDNGQKNERYDMRVENAGVLRPLRSEEEAMLSFSSRVVVAFL